MLPAVVALGCFSIATATSQNIQSVLVSRFFSGVFGSAPVSNVSAALGDMWSPQARATAMCFYAIAVLGAQLWVLWLEAPFSLMIVLAGAGLGKCYILTDANISLTQNTDISKPFSCSQSLPCRCYAYPKCMRRIF
jgi:MFS family permease